MINTQYPVTTREDAILDQVQYVEEVARESALLFYDRLELDMRSEIKSMGIARSEVDYLFG